MEGVVLPRKYRHLIYKGQFQIEALKSGGLSDGAIAQQLDSDRATNSVRAML